MGSAEKQEAKGEASAQKGNRQAVMAKQEDEGVRSSTKGRSAAVGRISQPSTPTQAGGEVLKVTKKGGNTAKKVEPEEGSSKGGSAKRARLDAKGAQRPRHVGRRWL